MACRCGLLKLCRRGPGAGLETDTQGEPRLRVLVDLVVVLARNGATYIEDRVVDEQRVRKGPAEADHESIQGADLSPLLDARSNLDEDAPELERDHEVELHADDRGIEGLGG